MIWNMSKWRGHAGDRYSWKIQTEADKEDVLLELKMPRKCQRAVWSRSGGFCNGAFFPPLLRALAKKERKKSHLTY